MKSEDEIIEVMAQLPRYREGLHLIGMGLFSSNEEISNKAVEVLYKVQQLRVGKEIFFSHLNINIQQVYFKRASVIALGSSSFAISK